MRLSLEKCFFTSALQHPEASLFQIITFTVNIFSWTGHSGGRTESGDTQEIPKQQVSMPNFPSPKLPRSTMLLVRIPTIKQHSGFLLKQRCRALACRLASALLLHYLLLQRIHELPCMLWRMSSDGGGWRFAKHQLPSCQLHSLVQGCGCACAAKPGKDHTQLTWLQCPLAFLAGSAAA